LDIRCSLTSGRFGRSCRRPDPPAHHAQAGRVHQHLSCPPVGVELRDDGPQAPHANPLLLPGHRQRLSKHPGAGIDRVRVDDQRLSQLARGSSKLAEDQHPALILASAHEFLGHQVHPVVETAHIADVGSPQESVDLSRFVVILEQDDGTPAFGSESIVDPGRRCREARLEFLIRRQAVPARFRDLNEGDAPAHSRAQLEQPLDGQKLLVNPFCVVQTIDADHQSDVRCQSKRLTNSPAAGLDWRRLARPSIRKLDRHRIGANRGLAAGMHDDVARAVDVHIQYRFDGLDEILAIVRRLQSDDGAAKKTFEELPAPGTPCKVVGIRPRHVPEGDDRGKRDAIANHSRRESEVIILHQDQRTIRLDLLRHGLGEPSVHRPI